MTCATWTDGSFEVVRVCGAGQCVLCNVHKSPAIRIGPGRGERCVRSECG